MNFSNNKNDIVEEFIEHFGGLKNIPNPDQYPIRFAFFVKSFKYFKMMQEKNMK
jgi:hypothetical protein